MKVIISNHRGYDIFFDTNKESFFTTIDEHNKERKTFALAKQYIDDYVKENQKFEPVWVEKPETMFSDYEKLKLVGIRKDGRFVYENKEGVKRQLSECYENDYFLCDERNLPFYEQLKACKKRKDEIDEEMKSIEKNIIKAGLGTIRAKLKL